MLLLYSQLRNLKENSKTAFNTKKTEGKLEVFSTTTSNLLVIDLTTQNPQGLSRMGCFTGWGMLSGLKVLSEYHHSTVQCIKTEIHATKLAKELQAGTRSRGADSWRPDSASRKGLPACLIPTSMTSRGKDEEEQEPPAVPNTTASASRRGCSYISND